MKIPPSLGPVGAGPVPALSGKTDATISTVTSQGRPQVAPLQTKENEGIILVAARLIVARGRVDGTMPARSG